MRLVAYTRYEGHSSAMSRHRSSNAVSGTLISRASSVFAITPSLNASVRLVSQELPTAHRFATDPPVLRFRRFDPV